MSSGDFNWGNLFGNLIGLAQQPPDPDVIAQFMSQLTGEQFVRVRVNGGTAPGTQPSTQPDPNNAGSNVASQQQQNSSSTHPDTTVARALLSLGQTQQSNSQSVPAMNREHNRPSDTDPSNNGEQMSQSDTDPSPSVQAAPSNMPNDNDALYDHQSRHRFPTGDVCYEVNDPKFKTSWVEVPYSHKPNRIYSSCLGVYQCPVEGCNFVKNPAIPQQPRHKGMMPLNVKGSKTKGSKTKCKVHGEELIPSGCSATVIYTRSETSTRVDHKGVHNHPCPHEKPSKAAKKRLVEYVTINPEATPSQILLGQGRREPAGNNAPIPVM